MRSIAAMRKNTLKPIQRSEIDIPMPGRGWKLLEALDQPEPVATADFVPTGAQPGCTEKVNVLRERLEKGLPLWHKNDFQWSVGDD